MVFASFSRFPNSLIRAVPVLCHIAAKTEQCFLRHTVQAPCVLSVLRSRFNHFSVNVKLKLLSGAIADTHWTRTKISREVLDFSFLGRDLSEHGVENP